MSVFRLEEFEQLLLHWW